MYVLSSIWFYAVFSLYKYVGYVIIGVCRKKAEKEVFVSGIPLTNEPMANEESLNAEFQKLKGMRQAPPFTTFHHLPQ